MAQKNKTKEELIEEIRLLQNLNEQQQTVLDASPTMIFYKDKENRFVRVNEALARANGMSKKEMEGKTMWDMYSREAADHYWQDDKEVMSSGKPKLNIIEEMKTPQGIMWVETDKIPYRDLKGAIIGIIGFTLDITERKKTEESLEKSEGLLNEMGKMAKVGGWEFDTDTLEQVWTEEVYRIHEVDLSYKPSVSKGLNFYSPASKPIIEKAVQRTIEYNESFNLELEIITAKGNHRWIRAIGKAYQVNGKTKKVSGTFQDITELRQAEKAFAESYNSLTNILDSLDSLIYVADLNSYELLFINKYGRDMWGDLQGQKCWQTIQKGQKGPCPFCTNDRLVSDAGRSTGVYQWEFQNTVNGRWYECRDQAITWTGKALVRMEIATDITERKRSEEALKESEETLRIHIENSFDVIFTLNKDGVFSFISPAWERHFGYPVSDAIGKSFAPFVHPDDIASLVEYLKRVLSTGNSETSPAYRVKHADGSWRWFVCNGTRYVNTKGVSQLIGVGRDITERKKTEDELRKAHMELEHRVEERTADLKLSTERLRLATEGANIGTWNWDLTSGELIFSDRCKAIFGIPQDEVMSYERFAKALHPYDREITKKTAQDALDNHKEYSIDYRSLWPDGSIHWISAMGRGYYDAAGKAVRMEGIVIDITKRKQAEKTAEEEIIRAEKMRLFAEMKSKLVATVSHELRSPLATVKECVSLVLDGSVGNVNDGQKDMLDNAKQSIDRLNRLVENVLMLGKIESGKMGLRIEEADINKLAVETGKTMHVLAGDKGLDLTVNIDEGIPNIMIDIDKIIQVITNLLSNAIKFTERGGITLSTKLEDDAVHVTVQDTGPGIRPEDMPKLFDAFATSGGTLKTSGGMGLGLSISKDIVLAHNGKIWAESPSAGEAGKFGEGSAFHFTLPVKTWRG